MSYTMTHLIISNEFAKLKNIAEKDLFLLASASPDAVHSREDFTFQIKADAHNLQQEEKWGEVYTIEAMNKWYDRLREFYHEKHKLVQSKEDEIFLKGYTLHILTDIFNCKLLYAPNLLRYDLKVDLMREEYRRECILQDNYLYQNYGESKAILTSLEKACEEKILDDILQGLQLDLFISGQNIKDNVKYWKEGFEKAEPASIENLEMLSEESTKEFLATVLWEAERLLYEFTEPIFI